MSHRTLSVRVARLVITTGLLLFAACTSDDDPTATASPTPTEAPPSATSEATPAPTATTAATPTPVAPTPAPTPIALVDGLPAGAIGPLFVFTREVSAVRTDRLWPRTAIVTYDLGARQIAASFEVGTAGSYATSVALAGREVIVNYEHSMYSYALNGAETGILVPPDAQPSGFSGLQGGLVSPDGALIAVVQRGPDCDRFCLTVLDVASRSVLLDLPQTTPGLDILGGASPLPIAWRDDSTALLVAGQPNGHRLFGWATVSLDGSVHNHRLDDAPVSPAPDARHAVTFQEQVTPWAATDIGCELTTRLDLHDLDTDRVLAQFTDPGSAVSDLAWSPDGRELLFAWRPLPEGGRCDDDYAAWRSQSADWRLIQTVDGSSTTVTNPEAIRQLWYPEPRMTLACAGTNEDLGTQRGSCPNGGPLTIVIDGATIDSADGAVRLLGRIDAATP